MKGAKIMTAVEWVAAPHPLYLWSTYDMSYRRASLYRHRGKVLVDWCGTTVKLDPDQRIVGKGSP